MGRGNGGAGRPEATGFDAIRGVELFPTDWSLDANDQEMVKSLNAPEGKRPLDSAAATPEPKKPKS